MDRRDASDRMSTDSTAVRGFPAVSVSCAGYDGEKAHIWYRGSAADLIACGAATTQVLAPGTKGRKRVDADGDYFFVDRYWRWVNGQPERFYRVLRVKVPIRLPGAHEAIASKVAREEWRERSCQPVKAEQPKRPSHLRLVVDNT